MASFTFYVIHLYPLPVFYDLFIFPVAIFHRNVSQTDLKTKMRIDMLVKQPSSFPPIHIC